MQNQGVGRATLPPMALGKDPAGLVQVLVALGVP